jgi:hypothetical protein
MAKRKPSPKATYVYVKDETAPAGSKKRGVTGGIKKEKTSPEKGSRTNVVTRRNTPEEIAASNAGIRLKAEGERRRKKADEADFGDLTAARRGELADQIKELPGGLPEPRPKKKMRVLPAMEATVPGRGSGGSKPVRVTPGKEVTGTIKPGVPVGKKDKKGKYIEKPKAYEGDLARTKPEKTFTPTGKDVAKPVSLSEALKGGPAAPDRGAEFGGAMAVSKGSGAPDAMSGTIRGSKVEKKTEPLTRGKVVTEGGKRVEKQVPILDSEGRPKVRHVYSSSPNIETTSTDVREMRSAENIAETHRRAKSRIQGGLKTTEFRPGDVATPSTSGDRKKRRAEKKLQRRIATGKVKTPERIGMGAVAAAVSATEVAAGKNKTATPTVSGSDVSAYMYSDEALAHELSRTHFSGHSASDIMDYVKHTGSTMPAFHKHVTNAHKAETETIPVGPPTDTRKRSKGKITRWRVSKTTGELESVSSYRGWHQTHGRDEQQRNVKVWKKFDAPKGSISHIEYLHGQITKHKEMRAMEASDTRERNRTRRVDRATASIVASMSTTPTAAPKSETRPPKGKSGKVKVSRPRPEGAQGPELATGKFSERIENPSEGKFTEVKKPRKRNLNY